MFCPRSTERPSATRINGRQSRRACRAGFTLVEIMVALVILSLMLTIIFVPLSLGMNLFHIGRTRSEVKGQIQLTLDLIERDLRNAMYVFPNDDLPGVTDKAPYATFPSAATNPGGLPYVKLDAPATSPSGAIPFNGTVGVCGVYTVAAKPIGNPSRLDMLLPALTGNGLPKLPMGPSHYLVTYYARRLDITTGFDPVENPVVLFRAQVPYEEADGTRLYSQQAPTTALNANTASGTNLTTIPSTLSRYPDQTLCLTKSVDLNRGSLWLVQNKYDEPDLDPDKTQHRVLTTDSLLMTGTPAAKVFGDHRVVSARGLELIAAHANDAPTPSYLPTTTFVCRDVNSDGKIDQVAVTLELGQYETSSGTGTASGTSSDQRVRLSQVVDLPNIQ